MRLKVFLLTLTLIIISAINAKAQVTIGMREEPIEGAFLDLKENLPTPNNTTATKGLGLPRVNLTDLNELYPMFSNPYSDTEKDKHIGLIVYNVNPYPANGDASNPTGLRVWDGSRWQPLNNRSATETWYWNYSFTNAVQTFTVEKTGTYLLEAWGAEGAAASSAAGGKGGYVAGRLLLKAGQVLHLYVGERKTNRTATFNGGAAAPSGNGGSGGGATDFRLLGGAWNDALSLNSRILVAGGGGGAGYDNNGGISGPGAAAGGLTGGSGSVNASGVKSGKGGTQTGGGDGVSGTFLGNTSTSERGAWGKGSAAQNTNAGGGGGGYYGGSGAVRATSTQGSAGGGGGSSFVSGMAGCVAIDPTDVTTDPRPQDTGGNPTALNYHSSFGTSSTWAAGDEIVFTDGFTIAGTGEMPDWNQTGSTMTGNAGNGYARITLLNP